MLPSILSISVALLSLLTLIHAAPQSAPTATPLPSDTACNNSPLLCPRTYDNITHLGAHDVAFLRDSTTSFSTAGNQFYNATVALSAGIRLLQAQVHLLNGTLELCHTSCSLLDGGPLTTWLADIKFWLDANPNEVVTILLVNSDSLSAAQFASAYDSSSLTTYTYTPSSPGPQTTWPTLSTMISLNTRLVSFIASLTPDPTTPYLLSEFSYVFETAFGVTSLSGFNCSLSRPSTLTSSTSAIQAGYLSLLNHFVDTNAAFGITVPDVTDIATTNSASTTTTGALAAHGAQCASEYGRKPTFLLVDFWNVGPAISTADLLNGVDSPVGRKSVSTEVLVQGSSNKGARVEGWRWGMATVAVFALALGNFVWL